MTARLRPLVATWLLLACLTSAPFLRASLWPPAGSVFPGTFYYVDDFYNYLSYTQQAADGHLLLHDKLAGRPHAARLLNAEWLLVGRLGALLGDRPALAYRLLGLVALFFLVALVAGWLRRAGLPEGHSLPALILVFTGGGLGGLLYVAGFLPGDRALDLASGLYPYIEALANPHFVIGTTLLVACLEALALGRAALGVALGSLLGLARPYDTLLACAIRTLTVIASEPPGLWPRLLSPILGLGPVIGYNLWLFFGATSYGAFSSARYVVPGRMELAWALGPAALLAAVLGGGRAAGDPRGRVQLLSWTAVVAGLIVLRPVSFTMQFLVGSGLPLLCLLALGLGRVRPAVTLAVALPLAATSFIATRDTLSGDPHFFVPASRMAAVRSLGEECRDGERVVSSPDVGVLAGGLTRCWPYVSHRAAPGFSERAAVVDHFFDRADPAWRATFLERACVSYVMGPEGQPLGLDRLPSGVRFEEAARGTARGETLWRRVPPPACAAEREAYRPIHEAGPR
jgi:hypothetical protein